MFRDTTENETTFVKPRLLTAELLDRDAVEIGQLYGKAKQSIVDSARYQLECGYRLTAKRQEFGPRGGWFRWLKANAKTLGFKTDRTARLLMAAWKRWRKRHRSDAEAYRKLTSSILDVAKAKKINRQLWNNDIANGWVNSGNDEWFTQSRYVELARTVLGGTIDVDPASCDIAQRTVSATKFFTQKQDGLKHKWHGRVWLNPPYSKALITKFTDKLIEEYSAGRVTAAVVLVNAFTSTRWFQKLGRNADALCLTNGRKLKFIGANGETANPAQGQAFVYFGRDAQLFARTFGDVGFIVRPAKELADA